MGSTGFHGAKLRLIFRIRVRVDGLRVVCVRRLQLRFLCARAVVELTLAHLCSSAAEKQRQVYVLLG